MEETRIVLLGNSGSGKSSLANTIFGEDVFKVDDSPNSGIRFCESKVKRVNERDLCLIDTPDLFDSDPTSSEILKCLIECAPGVHAFLFVLKVEKFPINDNVNVDIIIKLASEEALKYTTVVFTHGDDLPKEKNIEEWFSQNEALRNLVQKCGGRCHVFDNKYWNNSQDQYRNNQNQVQELLKTIDKLVRENVGEYYTNDTLQKVHEQIKQELKLIRAAPGHTSTMSKQEIREKAKEAVYNRHLNNTTVASITRMVGLLLGAAVVAAIVVQFCKRRSLKYIVTACRGIRRWVALEIYSKKYLNTHRARYTRKGRLMGGAKI